ncbi:LPD38 domain-containing protein [Megasphaera elsdenii]|uniref:LPD38 domain-containing protein n=1 Tax=Megasphaera elsdenii TaxID=907 RepID=UPI0014728F49|nr:LPD38 domain-containing protein [Megasphaera elsdenii]NME19034.1 transglycosylase SLT domain-containing protein [Megasphaera elsdenii]
MSKLLEYMQNANHPADVYIEKASDDSSADDSSSSEGSGFLSGLRNFMEHPFQGSGTVIAPNYTPRPLDDSVYSDIPGTPVASGQFGEQEDESVRNERMKDSADYMAANWPRLYGGVVAADEGLANVVGGIQNAVGGGNGILTNAQRAEEGMQDYRDQWNNTYGDSYFLNPNKFATDAGSVIGSSVPIMAFSGLMPGAAVAGGTRALTSALSRAGLGRLAMSKAGQALIADTVRSIPTSNLADSLSEYGTVVNDMMQSGMSEDEARRRAIPMFFKNMALDTFTVPLELGVMKGGKGIATGLLGRGAEEGIGKSLAKGAARTGMLAGASGLTEGYQEGAQNALENDVQGNRDGGWYNPFTWTKEDWEAARGGFVGGALMGVPGNVAAGFHPEARQAPLSAESQEQAQSIKDTLSHGKPKGMSNAAYNAYIELANSGNPDLIKQAASSLESFQESQGNSSSESTDDAATEAYKDYEAYDQKETIANFLDNNTVEQIGGEDNYNWLVGVLRNGTPEEVQKAYNDVIAAEKATAEQEAKNRPARSGGSVSPNTGNAMVNAVIQAANDSGVDPRLALAIAARESGGDDINAIHMPDPHDGIYGIMQAQDETVADLGLDSQYPDWQTDPYQNAMVGMAILKSKIANEDGDVWAGVRDYNGAGEEAEQYRQLVKNNYDNMGDIGGGGGGNSTYDGLQLTLPDSDEFTDQSGNVSGLTEDTRMKLRVLDNLCYQKFGQHLIVSSSYREGDPNNHGAGVAFDVSGGIVDDPDARQWLEQAGPAVGLFVIPEYQGEAGAEFAHGDNVHFSNVEPGIYGQTRNAEGHWSEEHAAPSIQSILKGGASSGVSSKAAGDNGQFERELDQAAQEAKSDMDKIQAQSDQAMNEIMNDDSAEKTAQDAQQDAESAQKQAEESQQSAQDDVVPDVAQTIRDTSNNIDEINTLDGMFTKDSNGNDKFIDTPENRDFIKANYKDEITKAVNDAMSKKKAPIATPVPKNKQQTPHARLGRILATYDRKDPKFKEYMNTFRNGTEQEQRKLADDLQTTQELERANSLKGNPLTTQQGQNTPENVPQRAVESPKQPEQTNTPTQVKESLETQKKRNAYLSKKQKLMERVPSGKTVKVHASTSDAGFDATYKIVPAGDITASHNTDYAVNDLYPAELQPRDRNRPQMRGQVEKMTKGMKPELLAESQFVNEGAPVVNNSGVVLNGNGRVMAIQKAYKGLTDAHKKSAEAYKDYLVSIAPSLGIAPEKVQSMDHPVLVRQAADDADTNAIINSTEGGAKLGGAEQAKADADRLKLSTLEQFVDNGTGEFMNPSNREFRRTAAKNIFSDAEGNSVFNAKGELSPIGALRIRNAIFAKAYKDDYLLTQLSEATDNNSKNIMNAMIAAAPEVAKVNEGIKEGNLYPDCDISDVITKTAKTIMSLRNEGKPLSFHLQETNLFSQGESEAERLVLEFIERNKFKSRTIADMYKAVCDRIFAVGSPKQSKLFDSTEAPRISLENIISNAIQEVEHGQSLFDTAEEKPAEKAVSEVPDNRQAEPAGSGRVHQQEAGRVQSQEKEGNEVDEKSKQSDHVNTEPQQTESKNKESSHAEEGPQSDVQAKQDINDAALSIGGKIFQLIERRKPRRYDKKAIFHYLKSVYITPYEENGSYYIDIDNLEIEKTIKVSKKDYDYAVKYTKDEKWVGSYYQQQENKEIKKAAPKELGSSTKETKPTEQPKEKAAGGFTDDEIKTLTDRGFNRWTKKSPNGKVMDRLYIDPEYLGLELTRYKSGNISSAKFNGETISNSEARRIEGTKCYVDIATKEVVCDREDLKQAAQEVIDDALSKDKSPVLAQAETKKAAPKDDVVVTGDEFGKYEGLKELRAKAKAYYKEHLQGTSVHNPILGDVELKDDSIDFTGKGISKAVSTSAKENKLLLIKYLPQLIENANEVASQPNVKDKREAKQYTYLMTHAIVGGKQENVIVTIFTDANGNKYYNHILNDEENKKRPPVYPAQAANKSDGIPAMREPFSTSIIPQKAEKWNKPDELRNQLSDAPKVDTKYSVREANDQLTRSKEDLKAEIKDAFPTAKEIKDEGDRMTFTMPNGSHIVVDLKNEILLTDEELAQAKKDHHIDDNGNVVVEGYAEVHGKDAYMALAQGSREGTGFHEAYHLAEGAVLTDREKAAIKKAIPDAEKRADKYAEWVEARKHGRGTAWGKLFQKIKDFAAKMKKIFTGTETVNNIFRQIESGRVWERNVREQGTKQSNQPLYQAKHIVSTFADKINLNRFVNAVLTHNEKSLIMHLGEVDADEAVAIKEATGYDVSNYEHVWRSNDVRHAQKRHGIDTETASDQIGLSPEEMVDALKVISAPDKIERGSINKEGPSIRYIKADNNGQLTIVEVVRSKRKTLDIKTMWKKRAEKLHGDYALQDTSETALDATSSTTENVAHNTDNVNGEKHYSIRKPKDAADEAQEKAEQAAEDTAVTMKDILAAARKILPIYTRSKIHYNSRATYRYDEHGRAGFVPSNYTLGDIGASIALHLDHVAQLKGANVELTNDVLDELEIEQRAAKKYKQEAPKAMTPVEARREGVKEFGRIYFQDPARAKEKYPKYYDIFEKTLDGMPEEKAAVEKILELEAQRAAQNPLLLATAGLSLADDRKKPKTVKERLNTAWARFYRTMVDETDPLRQITKCIEMELGKKLADEKDPHKRAVMCNSVAEGRASMLLFADNKAANLAYLNKIYKGAIRDKVTFEDVLNTLRKVRTEDIKKAAAKDVETYFGMYLVAQRTEEIVKTHKNYVRPEGYSHENCLRIIAEAPEAIRKAAQLYWKYNRNLVNIMEAEGLISEKQAAGLRKYEKYCPMYRDMSEHRTFDDELPTITAGRGFINQSSGIKKLKGGSILAVINPIDSMVSMTTALIARCERNDVAKVMVQSAEDHPGLGRIIVKDPSLFRADASKCAFTVMIAGKKTVYRTTPELYQALQEMSTNSAAFLTNVFGKFTDALRFGSTNTPSFMVRNFIRDTLSASVNARYGKFVPIVDSIRGMKALKGDADFRAKFYGQGVPMDTYIRRDIRGAKQYKDKVQKSLKRYPLGIRQLMALSRSLVHKYNDVGEALEQGTRAGAMLNALKAGASDFEAGQEARDVTVNFSRHGSFGKKVNRYVPFFNASIQGTDKVIRTFLENPKRASLATCLYIILPTIILWAINHDDDWYKELDDNTKYTNWAVHIPGTDYHWLIPKPQEVGIGFGSGVEAVLNQMLNEDPHAMKAWARQFAEVVTPGIIMTALRPVLEWRYNYSEWTGRKLVPERLSKLPPEQQYTTATSELAKLMSQFAGKYVGLSPIAIDNFFSGWFGSLGRMSANALNKPIDAIRGSSRPPEPARYWYESPFIGSFARQDGQNSVYVERFYQLAEDMEMDYKRSDSYAKNKGKKGAPIPASLKAAQTCMKTMTKINKDIRSIKDDPKMDPETKRKRIDAAYTKMRTYAKKFVTQYDK